MKAILIILVLLLALPGCMTAAERYAEAHQYDWVADLTPEQAESLLQAMRHQQIVSEMQWQSQLMLMPLAPAPVYLWGR
jgi:hypothetical protein